MSPCTIYWRKVGRMLTAKFSLPDCLSPHFSTPLYLSSEFFIPTSLSPHQLSFSSYFFIPLSCYGSISLSLLRSLSLSYISIHIPLSLIHSTAYRHCTKEFPHSIYPKMTLDPLDLSHYKLRTPSELLCNLYFQSISGRCSSKSDSWSEFLRDLCRFHPLG